MTKLRKIVLYDLSGESFLQALKCYKNDIVLGFFILFFLMVDVLSKTDFKFDGFLFNSHRILGVEVRAVNGLLLCLEF